MIGSRVRPQKPFLDENNYWYVSRYKDSKLALSVGNSSKEYSLVDLENAPKDWTSTFFYKNYVEQLSSELGSIEFVTEHEPERSKIVKLFQGLNSTKNLEKISNRLDSLAKAVFNSDQDNFDMVTGLVDIIFEEFLKVIFIVPELDESLPELSSAIKKLFRYYTSFSEYIEPMSDLVRKDFDHSLEILKELIKPNILDYYLNPRDNDNIINQYISIFKDDLYQVGANVICTAMVTLALYGTLLAVAEAISSDSKLLNDLKNEEKISTIHFDEIIRVYAHKPLLNRVLLQDLEIEDVVMKKGMMIAVDVFAASFDSEVFPNPHSIDFTRKLSTSIQFSHGLHSCMGRVMGRNIGILFIDFLRKNFSNIELLENISYNIVGTVIEPSKIIVNLRVDTQTDLV